MTKNSSHLTFSAQLKAARKQKGWTQEEAAEKLGINWKTLAAMENGSHPPTKRLFEIAKVMGLKIEVR